MELTMKGLRFAVALAGASALVLTACTGPSGGNPGSSGSSGGGSAGSAGGTVTVGTTDKVTVLDPAGSYDNGSFLVMNQVFPFVMNSKPGSADPVPDIAASASFTTPQQYTVKIKPGLKWANGHTLDAHDVKFSFDRQLAINAANGPASLLGNLQSVDVPDNLTAVFNLKQGNDQTFVQVLTSPAGPIVDDEVFPADKVMTDEDIVAAKAFAGPYTIDSYRKNELISFKANPDYQGVLGAPKTATVNLKYYANSNNLKLDVQQGNIDVAWRSLTATDIESLRGDNKVKVLTGPGGELRYMVFNFDTMPYGAKTPQADPAKALAVRQGMADLLDRQAIAKQVYKDTYLPVYSFVPQGFPGATEPLKQLYGDGNGGPSLDKAKKTLSDAGVDVPVTINLQYNTDHYGPSSGDEYALIKDQLEKSGLYKVNLQSTEFVQYTKDRTADVYPVYQLGWFPDYSDADDYLTPFFAPNNFLKNHYSNPEVEQLISQQVSNPDKSSRLAQLGQIQELVAKDLSTLPYLQGAQIAVSGANVQGVQDTLDAAFKFRLGVISK